MVLFILLLIGVCFGAVFTYVRVDESISVYEADFNLSTITRLGNILRFFIPVKMKILC